MNSDVAVFGLERTIADHVMQNALLDIAALGLGGVAIEEAAQEFRVAAQREAFFEWLTGRDEDSMNPFLERSAEEAGNRIAPWAKLVIGTEFEAGRQICLYSSTVPDELVQAYADGIEIAVPGIDVTWSFGKPLLQVDGTYTGRTGSMLKAESLERLQANGNEIAFVADSFLTAIPAIRKARQQLLVNPDRSLIDSSYSRKTPCLFWRRDDLMDVRLRLPGDEWDSLYDMADEEDQGMLLRDLGYNIET